MMRADPPLPDPTNGGKARSSTPAAVERWRTAWAAARSAMTGCAGELSLRPIDPTA